MASHGWKHKVQGARVPSGCWINASTFPSAVFRDFSEPSLHFGVLTQLTFSAQGAVLAAGINMRTKVDQAPGSQAQRLQMNPKLLPPRPSMEEWRPQAGNRLGKREHLGRPLSQIILSRAGFLARHTLKLGEKLGESEADLAA